MPTYGSGRHEHGQNFLDDANIKNRIIGLVSQTRGPIIEIGPGRGALTRDLHDLQRPLTAVEVDAKQVRSLRSQLNRDVRVVNDDFLRWRLPDHPHVLVGNLPFHLTTAMLRKVLRAPGWTDAVLLVQWEVARRRAGVGGASMMTAQWWPWVDFAQQGRVPASAFTPAPNVDGGILTMTRRSESLLERDDQADYREFVHAVFTGRGRGLAAIMSPLVARRQRHVIKECLDRAGVRPTALPKDLTAAQWVALFTAVRRSSAQRTGVPQQRR